MQRVSQDFKRGLHNVLRSLGFIAVVMLALGPARARAQMFPTPGYMRQMVFTPLAPSQSRGPEALRDYVVGGKLRLTLQDAVRLALLNNTDVRVGELPVENARFNLLGAYQPFDPVSTTSFNAQRSTWPTYSEIQGAPTLSSLSQIASFDYSQTFQTGTHYDLNFNGSKAASNSVYNTFNPSISGSVGLTLTQPLLRNRGLFPNRAPLVIARRNQDVAQATFEGLVNDTLVSAIQQYWSVVLARENLAVLQKSLEQAQATYDQNKKALQLGAIPAFDIYRSESQVATRRVQVIQAEYQLKQQEDALRRALGADLDPYIRALDLELVEPVEPSGELPTMDAADAYKQALAKRPEFEALRQQMVIADISVRLAHNDLLPDLGLQALYASNGLGGNELNPATTPPTLISTGGLGDALGQMRRFKFPTYGFTLNLRLPIRNRTAQAELGNALVSKRRSLYQMRRQEESLWQEVRNSIHQLEQAKLSIEAARIARDLAQKTLEAEQRKYELGASQIFFVLDAQTQLQLAESSLVQAEVSYQQSLAAVDHATGTLLEKHNVKLEEVKP
jgi:outer membrane protein TolC